MTTLHEMVSRLERRVGAVTVRWSLGRALQALDARQWREAYDALAAIRAQLDDDDDLRPMVDEAWLRAALQLAAEAPALLDATVQALVALPHARQPGAVRTLGGARSLGATLLEEGELEAAVALARTLEAFRPPSAAREYLAGRLLEAAALALARRVPLDGQRVLQLRGEADGRWRAAEAACGADSRRAASIQVRRAGFVLRLFGQADRTALEEARAMLGPINPFELRADEQLIFAALQLESPRRMRRVRALDVLTALARASERELVSEARRLLELRLARLGAVHDPLERDRLEGAIEALLEPDVAAAARTHLAALEQGAEAVLDPDAIDDSEARRYVVALLATLRGEGAGLPVPSRLATAFDAGRLALLQSRAPTPEGVARLWAFYRESARREDLAPLVVLLPVCLEQWPQLELEHAAVRGLFELMVSQGPTPRYGFLALAELAASVGEPVLAAQAAVRAARDARCEEVAAAAQRAAAARIGELVIEGVRALHASGRSAEARRLLMSLREACGSDR